ncbi:MAG: circadian clock protein KaiB [Myxococcales bacterium]|nr:MAG: circadian clock protein KaiB [Myxococcales bacterium]
MNNTPAKTTPFRFVLFVAGNDTNSMLARDNLNHICAEYLRVGNCTVTIVDVLDDFQAALDNNILVTPTLLMEGPRGRSTILGNLSDIDRIVLTLGCDT